MDAAKDGLNEARLGDDDDEVDQSVVDCGTTPACRHTASSSSSSCVSDYVIAKQQTSSSCDDVDSLTESVDDADVVQEETCRSVDGSLTTSTSTSVPLLQQLVSSPCDVITPVSISSVAATPPPPAVASDADAQTSLDKSFLQKLESFVSSVGQVARAPLPRPPLTGWIRRPVFPSRSAAPATDSVPMHVKRPVAPAGVCQYSLATLFSPPPPAVDSGRPLDLSAKRTESPAAVDSTRPSQRRCADLVQRDSGQDAVRRRFVDMDEVQPNGVNSLACLERDFGEHSTILTRLGSAQRQAAAALMMRGGAASRRDRTAAMLDLTETARSPARARICPPAEIPAPYAKFSSAHSLMANSRCLPTVVGPTGVVGGKPDSHHSVMSPTTAATALRCLQCGTTFFSLPELTLHMIQSAHYANLICAAAAYSADDEEDCSVAMDACSSSHQASNAGNDQSTPRCGAAAHLPRGKAMTQDVAHRRGGLHRSSISDVRTGDYLQSGAVSPARSLDDESVSSAGLTETESLRSPTSTCSPTSPPYDNLGSDDDLMIMSKLIRLQQLLSRTVLSNVHQSAGAASRGHGDWTAAGLAAVDERRRHLLRGRTSKTSVRQLDPSAGVDSLPIDLRNQGVDGSRRRHSQSRQTPAATKMPALALSRPSSSVYLEKLLGHMRGCHKSMSSAVKRPASSKWYNGKHSTKKLRTYNTSTLECNATRFDGPLVNGDCSAGGPTQSSKVCLRQHQDAILHGCRHETASGIRLSSSPASGELLSTRRQETPADSTHRSKDNASQPIVIDVDTADSPTLDRHADLSTTGRHLRRSSVDNDQSEYAARFGKYYRLAQELSHKPD